MCNASYGMCDASYGMCDASYGMCDASYGMCNASYDMCANDDQAHKKERETRIRDFSDRKVFVIHIIIDLVIDVEKIVP